MADHTIRFSLSPQELDLLLNKTEALDEGLLAKLRFGMAKEDGIHFALTRSDFELLVNGLAMDLNEMKAGSIHDRLTLLFDRLDALSEEARPDPWKEPSTLKELEEMGKLVEEMGKYLGPDAPVPDDMEAFMAFLQERFPFLGDVPLADKGNLTANQVLQLCREGWWGSNALIHIHPEADPNLFLGSRLVHNAFTLLDAIRLEEGLPATDTGNLRRTCVASLLNDLILEDGYKEEIRKYNKVINEQDVWPLHILRSVCFEGNLIRLRGKRYFLTETGEELLRERDPGPLEAALFESFFREFNLAYLDPIPEEGQAQEFFPVCLYHLAVQPFDTPMSHKDLTARSLPASIIEELDQGYPHPYAAWLVISRFLKPLEELGLVYLEHEQIRPSETQPTTWIRKTPLFDAFISVEPPKKRKSPKNMN